jgi:hypothetical protein
MGSTASMDLCRCRDLCRPGKSRALAYLPRNLADIYTQLCACVPSLRPLWTKITSWFSTKKARLLPTHNSSRQTRGDCIPPSMSWDEFDKDVVFDGMSSFHSASKMFNGKKKSHTTSVSTIVRKPQSLADSFCPLTSNNSDWEDVALRDLEGGRPKEIHIRASLRHQLQSF